MRLRSNVSLSIVLKTLDLNSGRIPNKETVSLSSNPLDANKEVVLERSSWGLGSSYVARSGYETVQSLLPVCKG